ncbi:MAG: hypothetical protein ACOC22_01420 [bacterium]
MKKIFGLIGIMLLITTSCVTTIPLQTNVDNQTMLLAENRNMKVNYDLVSHVADGNITYVSVLLNGTESVNNVGYKYASETAFKKIWSGYFSSKFNKHATDEINVKVTLIDLMLREQAATSVGMTMLTGNSKQNVNAIATFHVLINYQGKEYENEFEVDVSDYNETQQMKAGDFYYTASHTNPTQQKSKLLERCFNKSIIDFENFLRSIIIN